jgi:hypothetical protein
MSPKPATTIDTVVKYLKIKKGRAVYELEEKFATNGYKLLNRVVKAGYTVTRIPEPATGTRGRPANRYTTAGA